MKENSIVRENLMEEENYSPFCGSNNCFLRSPRTLWDKYKSQFYCSCGWVSDFPSDFIDRYKLKWNK